MVVLVADVGGTNTRLALAEPDGRLTAEPRRYRNDDHSDFLSVAAAFRSEVNAPALSGACIAIAGPVSGSAARLTNRDWAFEAPKIGALLGTPNVRLLNDIVALGHCLGGLGSGQIQTLWPGTPVAEAQKLVIGMGTGTNGCVVRVADGRAVVIEAELGHASLPLSVMTVLRSILGEDASQFPSTEHLFSGRGFSAFHALRTGTMLQGADEVVSAATVDAAAAETLSVMAALIGHLVRQFYFYYLPESGVYFAGSVARSVLSGPGLDRFEAVLTADGPFAERLAVLPVSVITDDAAALFGCARVFA